MKLKLMICIQQYYYHHSSSNILKCITAIRHLLSRIRYRASAIPHPPSRIHYPAPASRIYSVLNDSDGFASAALIAWKLTVTSAIAIDATPAIANTFQVMGIWNAKFSSHPFIK
jgi:hypothetical protein